MRFLNELNTMIVFKIKLHNCKNKWTIISEFTVNGIGFLCLKAVLLPKTVYTNFIWTLWIVVSLKITPYLLIFKTTKKHTSIKQYRNWHKCYSLCFFIFERRIFLCLSAPFFLFFCHISLIESSFYSSYFVHYSRFFNTQSKPSSMSRHCI